MSVLSSTRTSTGNASRTLCHGQQPHRTRTRIAAQRRYFVGELHRDARVVEAGLEPVVR